MEHELKTWPAQYQAIVDGKKTFEYRINDRGFKVGHTLKLREYSPEMKGYTGRVMRARVTYMLDENCDVPVSIEPGHVIMSIKPYWNQRI